MNSAYQGRRCLLVLLLAAPRPAAPSEPGLLRWSQVAARIASSPLVREADARVDAAGGLASSAGALPNPTFALSAGDAEARSGTDRRREWGLSVAVPLDELATRGARVAAARASERAASAEARGARAEALRLARRAFVALAHGQAQLEAQRELDGEVARLAALVRRRVERGEARPTELPRVEIERERLRFLLDRTRASTEALRERLAIALGIPVTRVEADLEEAVEPPRLEELEGRLAETAPGVEAARSRLASASEALSAERQERLPKLSLGAGHAEELDRRATSLTAAVTFPLWNWNGGRIRQAEANLAAERARLDAAEREVRASAAQAWRACEAGRAGAGRFRAEILPRAEGSARAMGRAFELGEAGLLDVIDARRVLLETRREYLDLLLDMQNACGDLAALAGLELP